MSITHHKNLLLNLIIDCISAKSAAQILSLNDEYTVIFVLIF